MPNAIGASSSVATAQQLQGKQKTARALSLWRRSCCGARFYGEAMIVVRWHLLTAAVVYNLILYTVRCRQLAAGYLYY